MVLPFANMGGAVELEHFADGVTESLTTDLSHITGALVVARNTAFTYKGRTVDAKQIGRDLNVRYIVEGSIQSGASRMRVNVQLIDGVTGNHLWADRFDKPLADLFDMQDEIVSHLANQLRPELIAVEAQRCGTRDQSRFDGLLFPRSGRLSTKGGVTTSGAPASYLRRRSNSIRPTSTLSSAPRGSMSSLPQFMPATIAASAFRPARRCC